MNVCEDYCDFVLEMLEPLKQNIKIILAHENPIKNVPLDQIIAAVRIKKCIIDAPVGETNDNSIKIKDSTRNILTTVGINLYVPYRNGTRVSATTFDSIFNQFIDKSESSLCEAKLLGTKYSRETQSLVTETEFVFKNVLSFYESDLITPIVPG
ncbi:MAG: hypothetical protein K2G60_04720 [Oscillospiraceae bacterium]|nr:hypothetical protein [Oscillospiraceae bacterium]